MFTLSNKKLLRALLLLLLIVLNIAIRLPSVPHEVGGDTFQIHALANSLSSEGEAKWWINWLSVFGMYSYSYASAVPFSLSTVSQLSGLDMEIAIYLFATLIAIYSIFASYLMAGVFTNNFVCKYLFAFFYSTSAGLLRFTFWNASARGLFLVFFLLFIFLLFTKFQGTGKKIFLLVILVVFLRSVHNFVYFIVPFILVYTILLLLTKLNIINEYLLKKRDKELSVAYFFSLVFLFLFPFVTRMFISGSRYQYLIDILMTMTRYIGPSLIFAITGMLYLLTKNNKTVSKWAILLAFLSYIPILYNISYGVFVSLPLTVLFLTIGFSNVIYSKKKIVATVSVVIIVSSVAFSSFVTHNRLGSSDEYFFMSDQTHKAGMWTRDNMEYNSRIYTTGAEIWRLLAVSNGHAVFPTLPPLSLTYGFVSDVENTTSTVSPWSLDFYFEGPYMQKSGTSKWGEYTWYSQFEYSDGRIGKFIKQYNIKYLIHDMYTRPSSLMQTVSRHESMIYNNGRIAIYSTSKL